MNGPYDDILQLPHPTSKTHPRMPREARAAQFAPFAALTGYEDVIDETGRLTNARIDLSDDEAAVLNERLCWLKARISTRPRARVTYFMPDANKAGGAYVEKEDSVKRIVEEEGVLIFADGARLALSDILSIEFPSPAKEKPGT